MNTPRIALYAGSFNPFHIGHLDILRQAEKVFDEVILGVGLNAAKSNNVQMAYEILSRESGLSNRVVQIHGTITATMKSLNIPTLIRGVRNVSDLVEEANRGRYLRELYPGINIVYLFPSASVEHVSSSAIRELLAINTPETQQMVSRFLVNRGVPKGNGMISGGLASGKLPGKPVVKPGTGMFASLTRKPE